MGQPSGGQLARVWQQSRRPAKKSHRVGLRGGVHATADLAHLCREQVLSRPPGARTEHVVLVGPGPWTDVPPLPGPDAGEGGRRPVHTPRYMPRAAKHSARDPPSWGPTAQRDGCSETRLLAASALRPQDTGSPQRPDQD